MKCKQGVSGVSGVLIWPSIAKLSVFVCATKKRPTVLGECGSNNTPQHPNTPFEKNSCFPVGTSKKNGFF